MGDEKPSPRQAPQSLELVTTRVYLRVHSWKRKQHLNANKNCFWNDNSSSNTDSKGKRDSALRSNNRKSRRKLLFKTWLRKELKNIHERCNVEDRRVRRTNHELIMTLKNVNHGEFERSENRWSKRAMDIFTSAHIEAVTHLHVTIMEVATNMIEMPARLED